MKDELIGIDEVSKIFGKAIQQMRNYKSLGIIEPITKIGNKDLYSKLEISLAKKILDENIAKEKLMKIGNMVQEGLKEHRKK